ncbi:MAG: M28 family peptidase [Clostridia bacterium]|nr:M28 family peptidase [Clostridia bacterium]
MKKVLIFTLIVFIVAFTFSPALTVGAEEVSLKDAYSIFEDYASKFPDRTAGSTGETNAASYIAEALSSIKTSSGSAYVGVKGGSAVENYIEVFSATIPDPTVSGGVRDIISRNVIAYKRSKTANAKLLVISCEYGNAYSLKDGYGDEYKSEGAYEFATSVAALLSIAYQLRNTELSFDVAFTFFGAGCYESSGVKEFLKTNEQTLLGNIDLYAVGGGKDLNVYYDEIATKHGKYIDARIAKFGYDIKSAPFDKKYFSLDSDAFALRHVGLSSSNYFFLKEGVPSVELFGYDWQSFGNSTILGTSSDTLSYMNANYDHKTVSERLILVRDFVVGTVATDGELAEAFGSYKGGYGGLTRRSTYWVFTGVALGVIVLLVVAGGLYYSKKTMTSNVPSFTVKPDIVEKPDRDDVYDFLDGEESTDDSPTNDGSSENEPTDNDYFGSESVAQNEEESKEKENNSRDDDDIFGEL